MKRMPGVLLVMTAAACGEPYMQRATVSAPTAPMLAARADAEGDADTVADPSGDGATTGPRRWLVTPAHTRIEVHGWGPIVGEQVFTFRRFRANVTADRTRATFHAELDTTSLDGGISWILSMARDQLLEADVYPRATFDGVARRVPGTDACIVDGTLVLHGVTRQLRFRGLVHEELEALRLEATFDMPRKAFDIRLRNAWDAFVPNDVGVVLDVRADREHVLVEEVDAP